MEETITFNEIKQAIIELIESQKETDQKIKELSEEHKRTELAQQKTELAQQKTELAQQKTEETVRKVAKQLGGIGNNNGEIAHQYFFRGLKHKMSLNGISFNEIKQKLSNSFKDKSGEYDILLVNADSIVIVEVKYSVNPKDVSRFYEQLQYFKFLFPMYSEYKIFGAIAGFAIPDDALTLSEKYGFFILTKSGKEIEILNHEAKVVIE